MIGVRLGDTGYRHIAIPYPLDPFTPERCDDPVERREDVIQLGDEAPSHGQSAASWEGHGEESPSGLRFHGQLSPMLADDDLLTYR